MEGLAQGGKIRRDGEIVAVPLAYKTRRIDFGDGEKLAMTIPWGDVSTAFHRPAYPISRSTSQARPPWSPAPAAPTISGGCWGWAQFQSYLKRRIDKTVKGPAQETRDARPTYVWGEVTNGRGQIKTARIKTANGYNLTVTGALAVVDHLMQNPVQGGAYTPARLAGPELVTRLPGSGPLRLQ